MERNKHKIKTPPPLSPSLTFPPSSLTPQPVSLWVVLGRCGMGAVVSPGQLLSVPPSLHTFPLLQCGCSGVSCSTMVPGGAAGLPLLWGTWITSSLTSPSFSWGPQEHFSLFSLLPHSILSFCPHTFPEVSASWLQGSAFLNRRCSKILKTW